MYPLFTFTSVCWAFRFLYNRPQFFWRSDSSNEGLRGLLVVRTFNTHLFASTFSFQARLFGFPFSLAVAPEPKPGLYYLPIYTNRTAGYLQCRRVNIYGAIAQDFGGTWPNCCWDYTLSQKAYPPLYLPLCASILCYMVPYCPDLGLLNTFWQCMAQCNVLQWTSRHYLGLLGNFVHSVGHIVTERYRSAHNVLRWTSWHHLWLFGRLSKAR